MKECSNFDSPRIYKKSLFFSISFAKNVVYFQFSEAVKDVIAHGHTDLDGNVELNGQFFYYSDSDLPPPVYEYKIIVYHYCKVNSDRKNVCYWPLRGNIE